MELPPTIPVHEARQKGYRALTNAYAKCERKWLEAALVNLKGCNVVLVETAIGLEIWRAANELKQ